MAQLCLTLGIWSHLCQAGCVRSCVFVCRCNRAQTEGSCLSRVWVKTLYPQKWNFADVLFCSLGERSVKIVQWDHSKNMRWASCFLGQFGENGVRKIFELITGNAFSNSVTWCFEKEKKSPEKGSPRSRIPRLVLHPLQPKDKASPQSDSPFSEEEGGKECDISSDNSKRTVSTNSFCSGKISGRRTDELKHHWGYWSFSNILQF